MPALANKKKRGSRGQKASRGGAQRSNSVPGKDAFNSVKKRPPPNLPGYEEEYQEYLRQRGMASPPQPEAQPERKAAPDKRKSVHGKKKKGADARPEKRPQKQAQPRRKERERPAREPERDRKPPKPVNPAKRRRNRRIAAILGIVVLIGAGLWFSFGMLFKIELYSVQGDSPYAKEEIIAAFRPEEGDNLFAFSATNEADKIEEQLPYIEELTIRRRLPGTVVFQVVGAEEKYTLEQDDRFAILSTTRKVLRFADKKPGGMIEIRGLEDVVVEEGKPLANSGDVKKPTIVDEDNSTSATSAADTAEDTTAVEAVDHIELLDTLLLALETSSIENVNWVNVGDGLDLRFRWDKRITVKLGAKSNLEEKLEFVKVLLTDPEQGEIKKNDKGTLDVSAYPLASDRVWFRPS